MTFYTDWQPILKFIGNTWNQNSQNTFEKEEELGGLKLLDFKTLCTDSVIKAVRRTKTLLRLLRNW